MPIGTRGMPQLKACPQRHAYFFTRASNPSEVSTEVWMLITIRQKHFLMISPPCFYANYLEKLAKPIPMPSIAITNLA
ncbi:hypothetical protein F8M41_014827 [Gigaspora margarita]|uniref:Uncharacterized protein n=1 Tax=Gigaspora margarita TaxID=4874 RepID=A0A8H4ENM8_GIGMA|nr:hypothetical protein F8M41_014827 [Gigaspora margarita]